MSYTDLLADPDLLLHHAGAFELTAGSEVDVDMKFLEGNSYAGATDLVPTSDNFGTPPGQWPGQSWILNGPDNANAQFVVSDQTAFNDGVGKSMLVWIKGASTGTGRSMMAFSNPTQSDEYIQVRMETTGELQAVVRDSGFQAVGSSLFFDPSSWNLVGLIVDSNTQSRIVLNNTISDPLVRSSSNPSFLRVFNFGALVRGTSFSGVPEGEYYGPWLFDRVVTQSDVDTIYGAFSEGEHSVARGIQQSIVAPIARPLD